MSAADTRAPIVLVWGDNDFLVREAARETLGEAREGEIAAADWDPVLLADLSTPSLFGEPRGLLVADAQELREDALADIARYAEDPAPGALLLLAVVVGPRASGPTKRLLKAAGDRAQVHRAVVDRRDLPRWIRERARRHGVRATPAGVSALLETVGEDPAVLDQAALQIRSAHPEEGLTPRTVTAQFRGFGDRRVWELCDAAFGRDLPEALRCLAGLLEAREEPLAILGGVASRLRDLIRVRGLPPRMPPSQLARRAGLRFDWQARRYREQAARFSEGELMRLHGALVEADQALKQGGAADVVLSLVVGRITQAAGRR